MPRVAVPVLAYHAMNVAGADYAANDHVAFGAYGRHHCLGASLARLELRILFEELLNRFDDLALDTDHIEWRSGNFVLGPESVPITFTTR